MGHKKKEEYFFLFSLLACLSDSVADQKVFCFYCLFFAYFQFSKCLLTVCTTFFNEHLSKFLPFVF